MDIDIHVRLDGKDADQLKQASKSESRSLTNMACVLIREALANRARNVIGLRRVMTHLAKEKAK